jgi:uncharacterized membrane protein
VGSFRSGIRKDLASWGYFYRISPKTIFIILGVLLFIGGPIFWIAVSEGQAWIGILASVLTGVLLFVLIYSMSDLTDAGVEAASQWRAFADYLGDSNRYSSELDANLLDAYLPYAVALWRENSWMSAFKDVEVKPFTWYSPGVFWPSDSDVNSSVGGGDRSPENQLSATEFSFD